jgi:L-lactate permease
MSGLEQLPIALVYGDLARLYDYAIADALGEELPELSPHLLAIAMALKTRVWAERAVVKMEQLAAIPDWLIAQQELKEREA